VADFPAYIRVRDSIRSEIAAAVAAARPYRLPTERELQIRHSASRPTISKALAGLVAEGLLVRPPGSRRLVVAPTAAGALGATKAACRVGFVLGDLTLGSKASAELGHRVFRGVDEAAHARGWRVHLSSTRGSIAGERQAALDLIASGVSGLIIWPFQRSRQDLANDYLRSDELGVPLVLLDSAFPEQGHTQVVFDNRRAGMMVTNRLLDAGHRRIALLTMSDDLLHMPVIARRQGYMQALRSRGLPVDPSLIGSVPFEYYSVGHRDGVLSEMIDSWLALPDPPTAIIALEDSTAIEIISYLIELGVGVPEDVCVWVFYNLEKGRFFQPTFNTTAPDFRRMGEIAFEALVEDIEGVAPQPRVYVLDVPLLERGPVPSRHPHSREDLVADAEEIHAAPHVAGSGDDRGHHAGGQPCDS